MKTIYDALAYEINTRLSCGDKWLIIDESCNSYNREFVVYEHRYGAKHTTELYRGSDEEEAVRVLTQ
jgi:hypothetical protein